MSCARAAANTSSMLLVAASGQQRGVEGSKPSRSTTLLDAEVARICAERAARDPADLRRAENERRWARLNETPAQRQVRSDQADYDDSVRADDWWIREWNRSAE